MKNSNDPIHAQAEKGVTDEGLSPMSPPEAFDPPADSPAIPIEELHPFLRELQEEHAALKDSLNSFETAILAIQKEGFKKEHDQQIRNFFEFFDTEFIPHNRQEERYLFPVLKEKYIELGEHTPGHKIDTPISILEDDHVTALQLASVIFNFFALAMRLPDHSSRLVVLDAALEQAKGLVELMKLHIFREDNIIFAFAHKTLSQEELDMMQAKGGHHE